MKFHPNGREKKLIPLSDRANSIPFLPKRGRSSCFSRFFWRKMLVRKQKPKTIDFRIGIFDLQSNGLILFHFSFKLRSIISIEIFFRCISLSPRICSELDKLYTKSSLNHLLISPIEIEKISTWLIQKNEIGDIKKKSGRKLCLPYRDKVKRLWGSGKFPAFSST